VTEPTLVLEDGTEDLEEFCPIRVVVEDLVSCVAARGYVVDGAGIFDGQWAGHGFPSFHSFTIWQQDVALQDLPPPGAIEKGCKKT